MGCIHLILYFEEDMLSGMESCIGLLLSWLKAMFYYIIVFGGCWTITKDCCCVLVDKKEGFGQGCDEQLVVCTPAGGVSAMKFLNLILSDGLFFP